MKIGKKIKVLNLYAGIGGNRKLWKNVDVTAVELNPALTAIYEDFYPEDDIIIADAHQYLLDHYDEYEFIWSSPPCQTHSKMSRVNHKRYDLRIYPDMELWQEIYYLKEYFEGKWVVENTKPYYGIILNPKRIGRHLFWSNFNITDFKLKKINNFIDAKYEDLQNWLEIKMPMKVYLSKNHDPCQVLRNCVHPKLGAHIIDCAFRIRQAKLKGVEE